MICLASGIVRRAGRGDREEILGRDFNGYLAKPISMAELMRAKRRDVGMFHPLGVVDQPGNAADSGDGYCRNHYGGEQRSDPYIALCPRCPGPDNAFF